MKKFNKGKSLCTIALAGSMLMSSGLYLNNNHKVEKKEQAVPRQKVTNVLSGTVASADNEVDVYNWCYLTKRAYMFSERSFETPTVIYEPYQKFYVYSYEGDFAYAMDENGNYGYMESYLMRELPKDKYVEVDISDQTVYLNENGERVFSSPVVTGKDSTPSDIGYFDIDAKTLDTNLVAYNPDGSLQYSSHVDFWMPYNYGEGLHDADGWRKEYGGEIYRNNGSHGCINMPHESAEYIYDNVDVGTMVLVHK